MNWFYAEAGDRKGPVTEEQFTQLVAAGTIRDDTLVWREGMAAWEPWGKVRPAVVAPVAPPVNLMAPPVASGDAGPAEPGATGSTGAGAGGPIPGGPGVICAECGRSFPAEETVLFGSRHVCAGCKPVFVQRLREGAPLPTGQGTWITEEQLLQRDCPVEVGESFSKAVQVLTNPIGVALGAGALVAVVDLFMRMIPYLGGILTLILGGALNGGLMLFYLKKLRGDSPELAYAFSGFGPRFGALLGAFALPGLITGLGAGLIGAVAVIPVITLGPGRGAGASVPMIILACIFLLLALGVAVFLGSRWQYALPLVADKNYGVTDAMRLSWRMVGKNQWAHTVFLVARYLVMVVGFIVLCVGWLFAMPLTTVALVSQYERMFHDLQPRG